MLTGIVMVPLLGGLALAIDYVDMSRQRQMTLNALDAATMATARRILEGASDSQVRQYAREFFDANLAAVKPKDVDLDIFLPANIGGGGRVKLVAHMRYEAQFLPPFRALLNKTHVTDDTPLELQASSEVQLKNTVEVALVLDNSGSMDYYGAGSGKKRLDLLKTAAKDLVDKLAATAQIMKQVEKPVQFSLVPFAASVNIGSSNSGEWWMDTKGLSSIHHENFDWSTMPTNKKITKDTDGIYKKRGSGWGAQDGQTVSRFTLYDDLRRCKNSSCSSTVAAASWSGCVESRPFPYNTNDEKPNAAAPDTLYVPMFGPDEAGDFNYNASSRDNLVNFNAYNTWWNDDWGNNSVSSSEAKSRQRNAEKYFIPLPSGYSAPSSDDGPNASCTTTAITPLTDVTVSAGVTKVKNAIDAMQATGATNVPEGIAWGWRTLSSQAPFTGGRSETERGNDKVIIVLTDGANTYYTPSSLGSSDYAGNQSIYSAYGYARLNNGNPGRIFSGTSSAVSKTDFSNSNYSKAMNEQFLKTCENANGGDTGGYGANIIIMTVALDLNASQSADSEQLSMLKKCASRSRYARDPDDLSKGKKLFWNATSNTLSQTFKEIADELSNLRFVS
ncbi:MAG: hypothetical protein M9944_15685 [Rhizobiaceae bacterium]|nr:hypothetical protein [Rhizobiaceae bacterium]